MYSFPQIVFAHMFRPSAAVVGDRVRWSGANRTSGQQNDITLQFGDDVVAARAHTTSGEAQGPLDSSYDIRVNTEDILTIPECVTADSVCIEFDVSNRRMIVTTPAFRHSREFYFNKTDVDRSKPLIQVRRADSVMEAHVSADILQMAAQLAKLSVEPKNASFMITGEQMNANHELVLYASGGESSNYAAELPLSRDADVHRSSGTMSVSLNPSRFTDITDSIPRGKDAIITLFQRRILSIAYNLSANDRQFGRVVYYQRGKPPGRNNAREQFQHLSS